VVEAVPISTTLALCSFDELTGRPPPDDWLAGARAAAPEGEELDAVSVVVKAGGGSFHHGLTWHGSPPNRSATVARMALVSHLIPVEATLPRAQCRCDLLTLSPP